MLFWTLYWTKEFAGKRHVRIVISFFDRSLKFFSIVRRLLLMKNYG
jgi:hypothetical protein